MSSSAIHKFLKRISTRTKIQKGLTLLEVMVSLAVIAMASIGVAQLTDRYSQDVDNALAADSLRRTGNATQQYIKDNYATITATAGAATPYLISTTMLISGGYLPTGSLGKNGFNQSLCALVLQPVANNLQAMVVTEGGTIIDDIRLGAIASLAGGSAGAVRALTPTQILGTLGGWTMPTASYHNLTNSGGKKCDGSAGKVQLTAGHPTMALWFENGNYQSATLYRDVVTGHPELNTMNTPIILNSVQTVGAVCTATGAISNDINGAVVNCNGGTWKSVGGSTYWADPVANIASLPGCVAGSAGTTRVVTTPSIGTGPRAYNCDGAAWKALAVDDTGNLVIGNTAVGAAMSTTATGKLAVGTVEIKTQVIAGAACSPNGSVATDSTGLILSCQSGGWGKAGGSATGAFEPPKETAIAAAMFHPGACPYWFDVQAKVDAPGVVQMRLVSSYGPWNTAWTATKVFNYGTITSTVTAVGVSASMRCPWSDDRYDASAQWP